MKFRNKNILIVSPEPWNHIFVSKHHYAIHLGKCGNRVFFLNPPGKVDGIASTQFINVTEVNYTGFPPGLRFYPSIFQKKLLLRAYKALERLCSVRFDVMWSFDNSVFFDFSCLPSSVLKISHIVDHNQDFQTRKAALTADFCFCSTDPIKEKLSSYSGKVYKINHGYSISRAGKHSLLPNFPQAIRAIYGGNLSISCIDWVLLAKAVSTFPHVDFVFIGPDAQKLPEDRIMREAKTKIMDHNNVFFMGRVDASVLGEYYRLADILLVAYQEEYHNNQAANSHKVMEYLGSGKVVVATHTAEYKDLYPLVVMSEKNDDWISILTKVVNNLGTYNAQAHQQQRRNFALANTYEEQILRIEMIITSAAIQ